MIFGLVVFSVLGALVLSDSLSKKPPEPPEEKLSKALADYLKSTAKKEEAKK
jgi:hypothetical protein